MPSLYALVRLGVCVWWSPPERCWVVFGEVADGLRGRVGWGRDRLRGSLRAIQLYYYYYSQPAQQAGAPHPSFTVPCALVAPTIIII